VRERWTRVSAILVADARERLRRTSSLVVFLAICFAAYLWVPDPSTGRALMVIDGRRALYNSQAIALATAVLGSFLMGLFGYYVVSRSIGDDVRRRTGAIVAASPVSNWEYLLGKGLGSFAFLLLLATGYMASSMVMQLVRTEEPLEIAPYLAHYLYLVPSSLLFTSMVALFFESVPWLAGKLGDVLYFFLWMTLVGAATALALTAPAEGISPLFALDVTGMATAVRELQTVSGTTSLTIGASSFDPARGVYLFEGLTFGGRWLGTRALSLLLPVPLFLLAWWRFHRFDPARVQGGGRGSGKGYPRAIQRLLHPVTAALPGRLLAGVGRRPGLAGATAADAALTLVENPLGVVALVVAAVLSLTSPLERLGSGPLPIIVAAMAVLVAGSASREQSHGTRALVYASPGLRPGFVAWKLAGSLTLCLLFVLPATLRFATHHPSQAVSLLGGAFFVAAGATAAGVLTGSSKTFLALFLSFWYVVLNDGGKSPGLDFAGFYGTGSTTTVGAYLGFALLLLAAAQAVHWRRSTA
jgi:ABC-type transport system involved in multi-copper enzyme maturation permease subunit